MPAPTLEALQGLNDSIAFPRFNMVLPTEAELAQFRSYVFDHIDQNVYRYSRRKKEFIPLPATFLNTVEEGEAFM